MQQLKDLIKSRFPFLVPIVRGGKYFVLARKSPRRVFTDIYSGNKWGDSDSRSGHGSNLAQTEALRRKLPVLVQQMGCRSILDIPCGDFHWLKLVDLDVEYIGADIVDDLVRRNQERYAGNRRKFIVLDLLRDELPQVDLVFCRDCLVHFSYEHVFRALENMQRSGSTYLLTTTFIGRETNENIPTGGWRPINLQLPPFNFPTPLTIIDEECPMENYRDKNLALWKLDSLADMR